MLGSGSETALRSSLLPLPLSLPKLPLNSLSLSLSQLILSGHSRVPIYKDTRQNIVGLLLIKRLIKLDPDDCTPIKDLQKSFISPPSCLTTTPLFDILNKFQEGRSKSIITLSTLTMGNFKIVPSLFTVPEIVFKPQFKE